jgi:hypothetical protein
LSAVKGAAPIDAHTLVGLLADDDRRRVVAALVLGASAFDTITEVAALDPARVGKALTRLAAAGLVERGHDGRLALRASAFGDAARARPRPEPPPADESEAVLRRFVREGRLMSIPTQRSKRILVLDRLAQEFEPGRHYQEREVNDVLRRWHTDPAALRRYLVDEGFLDRSGGEYWRAGGSVEI